MSLKECVLLKFYYVPETENPAIPYKKFTTWEPDAIIMLVQEPLIFLNLFFWCCFKNL